MTDRDLTATDGIREFRDPNGVRWQVLASGVVKRWDVNIRHWVESNYRLDELTNHPEIREVTPVGGDVS
jgi:hypothetical protein